MKKGLVILFSLILTFPLFSQKANNFNFDVFLQSKLNHTVPELDVDDLAKDTTSILIDVREKAEYDVSHIKNAMNFPYKKFKIEQISHLSKSKKIVVYCSVGYRSEKIAEKMIKAGYKNCSNLFGGIFEWLNRGNKVYDIAENKTKKIHAYSKSWGIWLEKGEKVYD